MSLQILDQNVLTKIFLYLDNPKDKASFAMSCKKIYRAYERGVQYNKFPDHRPHIRDLKEREKRRSKIKNKLARPLLENVGLIISLSCGCLFGISMCIGAGIPACCTVSWSPLVQNVLNGVTFGSCGSSIVSGIGTCICECCKKEQEWERGQLRAEYQQLDSSIKEDWIQLPKRLHMEDSKREQPYISYQSGEMLPAVGSGMLNGSGISEA